MQPMIRNLLSLLGTTAHVFMVAGSVGLQTNSFRKVLINPYILSLFLFAFAFTVSGSILLSFIATITYIFLEMDSIIKDLKAYVSSN